MLPAPHRFLLRHAPRFFSTARRMFSPYVTVWYQPSDVDHFQAAFIVPKKLLKKATDRHQSLRRLRAATQLFINQTKAPPLYQVVLMPTRQTSTLPFEQLAQEVETLLRQLPKS